MNDNISTAAVISAVASVLILACLVGSIILRPAVNSTLGFFIGMIGVGIILESPTTEFQVRLISLLVFLPISFFIASGILSMMLPTTFGRAILTVVCQFLIALATVFLFAGGLLLIRSAINA